jgi:hypothetical protein
MCQLHASQVKSSHCIVTNVNIILWSLQELEERRLQFQQFWGRQQQSVRKKAMNLEKVIN